MSAPAAARPVVAVVHATPASLAPVIAAFGSIYPEADLWHLLDDRLDRDAAAAGGLTDDLAGRMERLVDYAVDNGASAVQLACSMYGPVATRLERDVPVIASDQGAFESVVARRPEQVLVLASLAPAAADSTARLKAMLDAAGQSPAIRSAVAEDARTAALASDHDALTGALARAARSAGDLELVVLAQYSLSPVAEQLANELGVPVLSGPQLAASALAVRLAEVPT